MKTIASVLLSAVVGAGLTVAAMLPPKPPLTPAQLSDLLQHATIECVNEVLLVGKNPKCEIGKAFVSGEESEGWLCNGAWMPDRVQSCLDDAAEKVLEK